MVRETLISEIIRYIILQKRNQILTKWYVLHFYYYKAINIGKNNQFNGKFNTIKIIVEFSFYSNFYL